MGKTNLPFSYMKYLFDRITGLNIGEKLVDKLTLGVFIAALAASIFFSARDFIRKRRSV